MLPPKRSIVPVQPGASPQAVVFVVSADGAVRHSLAMLLGAAGFPTRGFESPMAFVTTVSPGCTPSCVVIDHHLPGGTDGLGLLETLSTLGLSMPAIVVSEVNNAAIRRRASAAGAIAVLTKPLLDDAILDVVGAALGQR